MKFVFPNHFNVYLHDTPAQALFDRVERDFSHGCVRLDEPMNLAQYVLRDQPEWTDEKIAAAMQAGVEQSVDAQAAAADLPRVLHGVGRERRAARRCRTSTAIDRRHTAAAGAGQ